MGTVKKLLKWAAYTIGGSFLTIMVIGIIAGDTDPSKKGEQIAGAEETPSEMLSEMTLAEYESKCTEAVDSVYEAQCEGKYISWQGTLTQIDDSDRVEMQVTEGGHSRAFDLFLEDDLKETPPEGALLAFTGNLKSTSGFAHDIENGVLGTVLKSAADVDAEAKAALTKTCKENWRFCEDTTDLMNNWRGNSMARVQCQTSAEEEALYGEPDFPWLSFGKFFINENFLEQNEVTLIEDGARYSNGFGAMKKVKIVCRYNLEQEEVLYVLVE